MTDSQKLDLLLQKITQIDTKVDKLAFEVKVDYLIEEVNKLKEEVDKLKRKSA